MSTFLGVFSAGSFGGACSPPRCCCCCCCCWRWCSPSRHGVVETRTICFEGQERGRVAYFDTHRSPPRLALPQMWLIVARPRHAFVRVQVLTNTTPKNRRLVSWLYTYIYVVRRIGDERWPETSEGWLCFCKMSTGGVVLPFCPSVGQQHSILVPYLERERLDWTTSGRFAPSGVPKREAFSWGRGGGDGGGKVQLKPFILRF